MKCTFLPILGTLAILLAGCSTIQQAASVEVQSPQVTDSNVGRRTSFAFVPHLNREAAAAVSNAPFWQSRIEAAITSVLEQKGYRESAQVQKADLLVAFHVVLRQGNMSRFSITILVINCPRLEQLVRGSRNWPQRRTVRPKLELW